MKKNWSFVFVAEEGRVWEMYKNRLLYASLDVYFKTIDDAINYYSLIIKDLSKQKKNGKEYFKMI